MPEGTYKTFMLFFLALVLCASTALAVSTQTKPKKHVLIINSYHQGLSWTDNIVKGIESVLRSTDGGTSVELYFEYMDTKRYYGERYFRRLYQEYAEKYRKEHFDVVIVADNDAFNFVRSYHKKLFPVTPVVFCGINGYKDSMLTGHNLFTGVVENTDLKSTIEIALRLHPWAKQVVVVNDKTTTGLAMKNELLEILPFFNGRVKFAFLDDFDMGDLQSRIQSVSPNSIILLTVVNRDKTGSFFAYEESLKLIYEASAVPIYSIWDFYLGNGITGGMLTSGFQQGKAAAEIALRILKGEEVSAIPVVRKSPNLYMFDNHELERFRVDRSKLPPESIIANKPDTFYYRYKRVILVASGIIVVLSIIIFTLLGHISMRKRYELALKESEEKYRDLYDNAPDMYHSINRDGIIIDCNETEAKMLGYSKEEVIGRPVADFQTEESRKIYENERITLTSHKALFGLEREFVRKDGTAFPATQNVFIEVDDKGGLVRTKTITRDVTEHKRTEAELRRSREELRNLSAHIESTREEERGKIAREIHDELGQTLSKLKLDLAWLKKRLSPDQDPLAEKTDTMSNLVDGTIRAVQRISSELRPGVLDFLGLSAAIEWQAREFRDRTGIQCDIDITPDLTVEDRNVATAVFRIFQEMLTNIMRHAQASCVNVVLKQEEDGVTIEVRDNGIGIPEPKISAPSSFGLMGIRERARFLGGNVSIASAPQQGTTVMVHIPLDSEASL